MTEDDAEITTLGKYVNSKIDNRQLCYFEKHKFNEL